MKKTLIALGISAALTTFGHAATITQTGTFSFVPTGSSTLTFNQFDTSLGTLTGINVSFNLSEAGGSVAADNDSASSGTITLTEALGGTLSSSDVILLNSGFTAVVGTLTATQSAMTSVGPTVGDPVGVFNATGSTDYYLYAPTGTATDSGSGDIASTFYTLGPKGFEGTGTYNIVVNLSQNSGVTGLGGVNYAVVAQTGFGNATVTYTYAVPEPATISLGIIGLGMAAIAIRRRQRADGEVLNDRQI